MTSLGLTFCNVACIAEKPNICPTSLNHTYPRPTYIIANPLLVMACIIVHRPTHSNLGTTHGVSLTGSYFVATGSIRSCRSDAIHDHPLIVRSGPCALFYALVPGIPAYISFFIIIDIIIITSVIVIVTIVIAVVTPPTLPLVSA